MEAFVWNEKYLTGIAVIDEQHRNLVRLINRLAASHATDADALAVFDELADYARFHFSTEEGLMQRYSAAPDFEAEHRQAHEDFVNEIREARMAAEENPREVTSRMLTFLSRWLICHILGTDMLFARRIEALDKGASPEDADRLAALYMTNASEILLDAMNDLYENLASRTHELWETKLGLQREIESQKRTEIELRKLSRAVESSPVSIMITDLDGRIEYVNPKFSRLTGYSLEEMSGKSPRVLKSGEMGAAAYRELWRTILSGQEWQGEFHNRKKSGELFWEKASISPIFDQEGKILHFLAVKEDITEKKLAEEALQRTNRQLAESLEELQRQTRDLSILNQMNELLQACSTSMEACKVVSMIARELGLSGTLFLAADPLLEVAATWGEGTLVPDSFESCRCWAVRKGQKHEVPVIREDTLLCDHFLHPPQGGYLCFPLSTLGKTFGLLHLGATNSDFERMARLGVTVGESLKLALSNIRLREALHEQAIRDPLTGLFNRRHLDASLAREIGRARLDNQPLTLAMIDIDHFKQFNDRYGHDAGDRVLVEVGNCIRANSRAGDIACRYGGEEFLLLLPLAAEGAARRVNEIASLLRGVNLFWKDRVLPAITLSAGIAELSAHQRAEDWLCSADQALYRAKAAGRDRVCIAGEEGIQLPLSTKRE